MEEEKTENIETPEVTKKSFVQTLKDHPKAVFWVRFVLWTICAAILPFLFIAFRFDIFSKVSKMSVSGWGIIAIIIIAVFAIVLVGYIRKGLKLTNPFALQCVNGLCKVLVPLCCAYAILKSSQNNIDALLQALGVTILCELVAIPVNPMPQWVYDKNKDAMEKTGKKAVGSFWDEFFKRKKEDEGK